MQVVVGKTFRLIKRLGVGAFAEVYKGINQNNNMEVAIKLEKATMKNP